MKIHGQELWADLRVSAAMLADEAAILEALYAGAAALDSVVLSAHCQRFEPAGLTAVVVIGESHLLASTYGEIGILAVSMQTCSPAMRLLAGLEAICARLEVEEVQSLAMMRRLDTPLRLALHADAVPVRAGRLVLPESLADDQGFSASKAIR